jgi:hypothetical protein
MQRTSERSRQAPSVARMPSSDGLAHPRARVVCATTCHDDRRLTSSARTLRAASPSRRSCRSRESWSEASPDGAMWRAVPRGAGGHWPARGGGPRAAAHADSLRSVARCERLRAGPRRRGGMGIAGRGPRHARASPRRALGCPIRPESVAALRQSALAAAKSGLPALARSAGAAGAFRVGRVRAPRQGWRRRCALGARGPSHTRRARRPPRIGDAGRSTSPTTPRRRRTHSPIRFSCGMTQRYARRRVDPGPAATRNTRSLV